MLPVLLRGGRGAGCGVPVFPCVWVRCLDTYAPGKFRWRLPSKREVPGVQEPFLWYGMEHTRLLDTFKMECPYMYRNAKPGVMVRRADSRLAFSLSFIQEECRRIKDFSYQSFVLDGGAGCGKSAALALAGEWALRNNWEVLTLPVELPRMLVRKAESWQLTESGNYVVKREAMEVVKHWQAEASKALKEAPLPFKPSEALIASLKSRVLDVDKAKEVRTFGDVLRLGSSHRNNATAAISILCSAFPEADIPDRQGLLVLLDGVNYLHPSLETSYILKDEDGAQDSMLAGELQTVEDLFSLTLKPFKRGLCIAAISRSFTHEIDANSMSATEDFPGSLSVYIRPLTKLQVTSVWRRMTRNPTDTSPSEEEEVEVVGEDVAPVQESNEDEQQQQQEQSGSEEEQLEQEMDMEQEGPEKEMEGHEQEDRLLRMTPGHVLLVGNGSFRDTIRICSRL